MMNSKTNEIDNHADADEDAEISLSPVQPTTGRATSTLEDDDGLRQQLADTGSQAGCAKESSDCISPNKNDNEKSLNVDNASEEPKQGKRDDCKVRKLDEANNLGCEEAPTDCKDESTSTSEEDKAMILSSKYSVGWKDGHWTYPPPPGAFPKTTSSSSVTAEKIDFYQLSKDSLYPSMTMDPCDHAVMLTEEEIPALITPELLRQSPGAFRADQHGVTPVEGSRSWSRGLRDEANLPTFYRRTTSTGSRNARWHINEDTPNDFTGRGNDEHEDDPDDDEDYPSRCRRTHRSSRRQLSVNSSSEDSQNPIVSAVLVGQDEEFNVDNTASCSSGNNQKGPGGNNLDGGWKDDCHPDHPLEQRKPEVSIVHAERVVSNRRKWISLFCVLVAATMVAVFGIGIIVERDPDDKKDGNEGNNATISLTSDYSKINNSDTGVEQMSTYVAVWGSAGVLGEKSCVVEDRTDIEPRQSLQLRCGGGSILVDEALDTVCYPIDASTVSCNMTHKDAVTNSSSSASSFSLSTSPFFALTFQSTIYFSCIGSDAIQCSATATLSSFNKEISCFDDSAPTNGGNKGYSTQTDFLEVSSSNSSARPNVTFGSYLKVGRFCRDFKNDGSWDLWSNVFDCDEGERIGLSKNGKVCDAVKVRDYLNFTSRLGNTNVFRDYLMTSEKKDHTADDDALYPEDYLRNATFASKDSFTVGCFVPLVPDLDTYCYNAVPCENVCDSNVDTLFSSSLASSSCDTCVMDTNETSVTPMVLPDRKLRSRCLSDIDQAPPLLQRKELMKGKTIPMESLVGIVARQNT